MASLTDNKSFLTDLINAGADAMSNLYYVELSGGLIDDSTKLQLKLRNKDFKPPQFTQGKITQNYLSVSLDVPSASFSGTKEFSCTFRVDLNYNIYKKLCELMAVTSMPNLGFAATDVPDATTKGMEVRVYAVNSTVDSNSTEVYDPSTDSRFSLMHTYKYCWIKSITGLNYSYNEASAVTVTATFGFFQFKDEVY